MHFSFIAKGKLTHKGHTKNAFFVHQMQFSFIAKRELMCKGQTKCIFRSRLTSPKTPPHTQPSTAVGYYPDSDAEDAQRRPIRLRKHGNNCGVWRFVTNRGTPTSHETFARTRWNGIGALWLRLDVSGDLSYCCLIIVLPSLRLVCLVHVVDRLLTHVWVWSLTPSSSILLPVFWPPSKCRCDFYRDLS